MTYQKIEIKGRKFFIDIDKKRTACYDCGEMIRFAQDEKGKFYPVNMAINKWVFHKDYCHKIPAGKLENRINNEKRNQDFLSNL